MFQLPDTSERLTVHVSNFDSQNQFVSPNGPPITQTRYAQVLPDHVFCLLHFIGYIKKLGAFSWSEANDLDWLAI